MPSGPKKRKSMKKKKMGCLHVITNIQQGNGGSDSGGGIYSPMSLVAGHFEGQKRKKKNGREETGSGEFEEDMVSSDNVGRAALVVGGDDPAVVAKSPPSSDTAVAVRILQQKVNSVYHAKESSKETEIGNPKLMCVPAVEVGKEMLENAVPSAEESVDLCEEAVSVFEAKEVAEHVSHVLFEKVNSLLLGQPPSGEKEEKVETLTSGKPLSDGKEENMEVGDSEESPTFYKTEGTVETFGPDQPPLVEKEGGVISSAQTLHGEGEQKCKVEVSCLVEHLASSIEEKVISSYACAFSKNLANGVKKQDIMLPQKVLKTSWLNCCGLFDAFIGQKR